MEHLTNTSTKLDNAAELIEETAVELRAKLATIDGGSPWLESRLDEIREASNRLTLTRLEFEQVLELA